MWEGYLYMFCMAFLFGSCGNGLLEIALWSTPGAKYRSPLLYGLVASDFFVSVVGVPITAGLTAGQTWLDDWPHLALFLQGWTTSTTMFSMLVISVDRYLTIRRYRPAPQVQGRRLYLLSIVFATWASAGIVACSQLLYLTWRRSIACFQLIIVHLIPACTVVISHARVYSKLTALSLTARAKHGELPLPMPLLRRPTHVIIVAGIPNTHRSLEKEGRNGANSESEDDAAPTPGTTLKSRRRLANNLLWVTAYFVISWIPYTVSLFFVVFDQPFDHETEELLLFAGQSHSAITPFIYWILNCKWLHGPCHNIRMPSIYRSASSTNEAQLGPFHPRFVRPPPVRRRSSQYLY